MDKKDLDTKKQTNLMLSARTHLRLKVLAALTQKTMGDLIWTLLERLEPEKSVDDDLETLEIMEKMKAMDLQDNEKAEQAL